MNWINLNTTTLDSEEFLDATPTQRATWLCLLRYCVGQENGGRIEGAKPWKDRKWQQIVRIKLKEITSSCNLWRWDGEDLVVAFYPTEKETEIRERRERSKINGFKGGRPKHQKTHEEPTLVSTSKPGTNPRRKAEGEREEKEKEKEKEKGSTPNPPKGVSIGIPESSPGSNSTDPNKATHPDPRVLPHRWRHIARSDRKNHRVLGNNRLMQRIGAWFGRRHDDLWNLAEAIALSQLNPPKDETDLLETYYLAPLARDADYRRRDLLTLLNHWHSELDRARIWQAESPTPCISAPQKR